MLAYYVQHGYEIQYNADQFYQLLLDEFQEADGYWFRDEAQLQAYRQARAEAGEPEAQAPLFIVDERSAIQWLKHFLRFEGKIRSLRCIVYLAFGAHVLSVVLQAFKFGGAHMPPDAMWYTPTISRFGEQILSPEPPGLRRSVAVIKRMRKLFAAASLPYRSPHKFRHGHAVFALQHARTMADYKAVSMNLMHEDIRVTDGIYAPLAHDEVQQRIAGLTDRTRAVIPADGDLVAFVHSLSQQQMSEALILIGQRLAA